jgi:hypothetical protein
MPIKELIAIAGRFHALAQKTSDPVMKERLITLGDDYLKQADQLKCERKSTQAVYPKSGTRNDCTSG